MSTRVVGFDGVVSTVQEVGMGRDAREARRRSDLRAEPSVAARLDGWDSPSQPQPPACRATAAQLPRYAIVFTTASGASTVARVGAGDCATIGGRGRRGRSSTTCWDASNRTGPRRH